MGDSPIEVSQELLSVFYDVESISANVAPTPTFASGGILIPQSVPSSITDDEDPETESLESCLRTASQEWRSHEQ